MKRLVIHIGTEKTGTTSIQEYFSANADDLLKNNSILYPDFGYSSLAQFELVAALHPMCNAGRLAEFAPKKEYDPDDTWSEFCRLINESKEDLVVISSEHFSSRLNAEGVAFIKDKLDKELPEYKVEIVVYLRNQVDMFQSSYSTYIKTGGTKSIFELFQGMGGSGTYYNFYNLIKQWSDQFGKSAVIVRNFNELPKVGGVVADFLNYLGVSKFSIDPSLDKNSTWNPVFLEFARNLNCGLLKDEDHGTRYARYETILKTYTCFQDFNGFSVLPDKVSFEVEKLFSESNIKLNTLLNNSTNKSYFEAWKPKKIPYNYESFSAHLSEVLFSDFTLEGASK